MMSRRPIAAGLCLLLSSLAGCADKPPAARVAAQQEARRAEEQVALNRKMQLISVHFERIKKAVITAELANAQAEAEGLRRLRIHPKTPGLAAYAESYMQAVAEIEQSGDLDAAAGAAVRLAMVCGACHAAEGSDPGLGIPARPSGTTDPWGKKRSDEKVHMTVQQWGVDRMWEALMTPSDEMWTAGVNAFVEKPVEEIDPNAIPKGVKFKGKIRKASPDELPKKKPEKPRSPEHQAFVDRLATATAPLANAGGPTDPAERARVLGEILAICAGCHQLPPPEKDDDAE